MQEDRLFFVGQKAFIEKDRKILILNDPWVGLDFPGGKMQKGETNLIAALRREIKEETSLEIKIGLPFFTWCAVIKNPKHKYVGEKVIVIAYKCTYLSGKLTLSDEHDKYFWVDKDSYKEYDFNDDMKKALKIYFAA